MQIINTTLAFTAIALVAGIMMIGSFAPMAIADKGGVPHDGSNGKGKAGAPGQQDKPAKAEKVEICHNGQTISVSEKAAAKHLEKHLEDTEGTCEESEG